MSSFVDWAINFEQRELKMQKGGDYISNQVHGDIPDEEEYSSDESEEDEKIDENESICKGKKKKQTSFDSVIYAHAGYLFKINFNI
jgi:hypothetical protein